MAKSKSKNDRDDKDARKVAAKASEQPKPKATPGPDFQVQMETPEGKTTKVNCRIRPGFPSVRFRTKPVQTAALVKLSEGNKLTAAELAQSPVLRGVTPEEAKAFLQEVVAKGGYWITTEET